MAGREVDRGLGWKIPTSPATPQPLWVNGRPTHWRSATRVASIFFLWAGKFLCVIIRAENDHSYLQGNVKRSMGVVNAAKREH
jgi:hypothetical protein